MGRRPPGGDGTGRTSMSRTDLRGVSSLAAMGAVVLLMVGCEREPSKAEAEAKTPPVVEKQPEPKKPEPTGLDRSAQASHSMESLRAELQKGKLQIDTTLSALGNVVKDAEGNPKPYFE